MLHFIFEWGKVVTTRGGSQWLMGHNDPKRTQGLNATQEYARHTEKHIKEKKKWKEREKWRSGKNRWIYVVIFKELLRIKGMGGRVTLIGLRLFRKYHFIWCDRYGVWWWRIPQDEWKIGRISYSTSLFYFFLGDPSCLMYPSVHYF